MLSSVTIARISGREGRLRKFYLWRGDVSLLYNGRLEREMLIKKQMI